MSGGCFGLSEGALLKFLGFCRYAWTLRGNITMPSSRRWAHMPVPSQSSSRSLGRSEWRHLLPPRTLPRIRLPAEPVGVLTCCWLSLLPSSRHLVSLTNLKPVNPVPAWNVCAGRKGAFSRSEQYPGELGTMPTAPEAPLSTSGRWAVQHCFGLR